MDTLKIFENPEFGEIRSVIISCEPWFVARDICKALKIETSQTRRLDEDEKGRHLLQTPGGMQEMLIINEFGLYNLVLGSRKAEAKSFKRWVTHDVLPSIRKTGKYDSADSSKQMLAEARLRNAKVREASMWMKILDTLDSTEYRQTCASYASSILSGKEVIPLPEKSEKLYTNTEVAVVLGMNTIQGDRVASLNNLRKPEYGKWIPETANCLATAFDCFQFNAKGLARFHEMKRNGTLYARGGY